MTFSRYELPAARRVDGRAFSRIGRRRKPFFSRLSTFPPKNQLAGGDACPPFLLSLCRPTGALPRLSSCPARGDPLPPGSPRLIRCQPFAGLPPRPAGARRMKSGQLFLQRRLRWPASFRCRSRLPPPIRVHGAIDGTFRSPFQIGSHRYETDRSAGRFRANGKCIQGNGKTFEAGRRPGTAG